MFNKTKFRLWKLLVTVLAVSLILGIFIQTSLATEVVNSDNSSGQSYAASPESVKKINQLWGKKISRADFIQEVFPGALADMPKDVVRNLRKEQMQWPDPDGKSNDTDKVSAQTIYVIGYESNISASGNVISFDSGNRVWLPTPYTPMPYMDVFSFLWEDVNGSAKIMTSTYNRGYNVYRVVAASKYQTPHNGRFKTTGSHYALLPTGESRGGVTGTAWLTVAPY